MAKFELKKNVVDLEFDNTEFHIPVTDTLMTTFDKTKEQFVAQMEEINKDGAPSIAAITETAKTAINALLGDDAFDKICGADEVNAIGAASIAAFVFGEIAKAMTDEMDALSNHPALKK